MVGSGYLTLMQYAYHLVISLGRALSRFFLLMELLAVPLAHFKQVFPAYAPCSSSVTRLGRVLSRFFLLTELLAVPLAHFKQVFPAYGNTPYLQPA